MKVLVWPSLREVSDAYIIAGTVPQECRAHASCQVPKRKRR